MTTATAPTRRTAGVAQRGSPIGGYPAKIIGTPYVGTHTLFGNWESDNAVDLSVPVGTPLYAVAAGTIGPASQFGPLDSSDPKLAGLRLHLQTASGEFYYAHLSRFATGIGPEVKVQAGQLLGYSGSANGTAHLHFAASQGTPFSFISSATPEQLADGLQAAIAHGIPVPGAPPPAGGGGSVIGDAAHAIGGVASGAGQAAKNAYDWYDTTLGYGQPSLEKVGDVIKGPVDALKWIFDEHNLIRVAYVIGGGLLVGLGLLSLARSLGAVQVNTPGPLVLGPTPPEKPRYKQSKETPSSQYRREHGQPTPKPKPKADFGEVPF